MTIIEKAMILAAGLGTRMGRLSENKPKPLFRVLGKPLINYGIDHCNKYGVEQIVVNTHYLANQIEQHFSKNEHVTTLYESDRLETGGGVKNALKYFGDKPFFVLNSDALWIDGPSPALQRLTMAWDEKRMDALLLFYPVFRLFHYTGCGDFYLDSSGIAKRRIGFGLSPFIFAGVQILNKKLFHETPDGPFSLNVLYNRAEATGRLYAIVHDGDWYHVGTPSELHFAESKLAQRSIKINNR